MPNMWKTADKFLNLISLLVSVLGFQFRSIGTQFELNITLDFLIVQIFLSFCTVLNWKSYRNQKRRSLLRAFLQKSLIVFPPSTPPYLFFHSFHVYVCLLQRVLSFYYFFLSFLHFLYFFNTSRGVRGVCLRNAACISYLSLYLSILSTYLSANLSTFDRVETLYAPYAQCHMYEQQQQQQLHIYIYTTYIFTVTLV